MSRPASPARRVSALLLLVGYAALIFQGSSGAAPPSVISLGIPDYGLHFAEYFGFGLLAAHWLRAETGRSDAAVLVLAPLLITAAWGAADEIHQAFVPVRFPDVADLLADMAGGLCGALAYRVAGVRERKAERA